MPILIALIAFGLLAATAGCGYYLFGTGGSIGWKLAAVFCVIAVLFCAPQAFSAGSDIVRYIWAGVAVCAAFSAAECHKAWNKTRHRSMI